MTEPNREQLQREHEPDAVRDRLGKPTKASTLPDAVLGRIEGTAF